MREVNQLNHSNTNKKVFFKCIKKVLVSTSCVNPSPCFASFSFFTRAIANSLEFMPYLQNATHFNLIIPPNLWFQLAMSAPYCLIAPLIIRNVRLLGNIWLEIVTLESLLSIFYLSFVKRYFCVGQCEVFLAGILH